MKKLKLLILLLVAAPALILTSCKDKEDSAGLVSNMTDESGQEAGKSVQLTIKMTDAPAIFNQVNVEIIQVSVHYGDTTESGIWVDLATNAGIYDLLTLQDSLTVVLADASGLPTGEISQVRLLLGDENTVVVDSVAFPLKTPSGQQTGLKVNLDTTLEPGFIYEVLLDFDAEKSVVVHGNGNYHLKPVIKVESILVIPAGGDEPLPAASVMSTYETPPEEN